MARHRLIQTLLKLLLALAVPMAVAADLVASTATEHCPMRMHNEVLTLPGCSGCDCGHAPQKGTRQSKSPACKAGLDCQTASSGLALPAASVVPLFSASASSLAMSPELAPPAHDPPEWWRPPRCA